MVTENVSIGVKKRLIVTFIFQKVNSGKNLMVPSAMYNLRTRNARETVFYINS